MPVPRVVIVEVRAVRFHNFGSYIQSDAQQFQVVVFRSRYEKLDKTPASTDVSGDRWSTNRPLSMLVWVVGMLNRSSSLFNLSHDC